jgi:photosystem II stability/assembly factor-like uncharacterized protein
VTLLRPRRSRAILLVVLTLGLSTLCAVPGQPAEPSAREKEIANLEKQFQAKKQELEELAHKLEQLKKDGTTTPAAPEGSLPADWVKQFNWRCIGPATMGGRITAISAFDADPTTYWVATASGGLLRTTNNGVTFDHQFQREGTVSIGDVCVAPSDRNIVWVGTGENNPRNSVSYGDGVYKSVDGGKTWQNMGLKKTFQIGRIAIHPKNPNIVYVGALGRLYGPNEDRGLYKTTDGGKTWERVLFVDERTGVIDVALNPNEPDTLLVAMWERQRDEFDSHPGTEMPPAEGYDRYDPIKKWGPGSGLYKSIDGGKSFKKITHGLPASPLGRIGLDYYRKNPNTVYAVIDCEKIGMGPKPVYLGVQGEDNPEGAKLTQITDKTPASKAGLKAGDIVTMIDKKPIKKYSELVYAIESTKAGTTLALTVKRDKETKEISAVIEARPDPADQANPPVYLGFQGEPEESGVKVLFVTDGGPASKAGLKVDDLLLSIDKKEIKDNGTIFESLRDKKPGDKLTLSVKRGADKKDIVVTLERRPGGPQGGTGRATVARPYSFMYGGQAPNVQHQQGSDGYEYGGVFKSVDGGDTWVRINSLNPRPMYFSLIRVDPSDENNLYVGGVSLYRSSDGGKTFTGDGGNGVHPDNHALWIDSKDGRHMLVGGDGGFYATFDRMQTWDHLNHASAIGQFYHVALDNRRPYRVYGGLQDNGTWGGLSHSLHGAPTNDDWFTVSGGDGFVCRVDPSDSDIVYGETQDGNIFRRNLKTGEGANIRPRQSQGAPPYRFNWNTPFILSSHNPRILYSGGNFVFRSVSRGADLRVISPEITRTKRGSATALSESPRNPDILWAGTDDGFLWVTRDGGKEWKNVTERVGLPGPRWVASIEASRGADGRCYVAFDGHRSNDDSPLVYVTEDFGQTWKSLQANLPEFGSARVLREDIQNPALLFVGTEFGAFASTNRGASWTKINNNLPTVAVHEFALHPTAGEVVVATHGRSVWIMDVTALRQMTKEALAAKAHLYRPNTAVNWRPEPGRGSMYGNGARHFQGQNPPNGAEIYYSLNKKAEKLTLKVLDYAGKTVAELDSKGKDLGLHRVAWNPGRGPGRQGGGGGRLPPATYRVVLTVDGEEFSQPLRVEDDPNAPPDNIAEGGDEKPWEDIEEDEDGKPRVRIDY